MVSMEILLEMLNSIAPAVITSLFTFLITKYTYTRDMPLEKLEISYNRIYYPLYYCMFEENKDMESIINESDFRFKKYRKYVDRSTLSAFNSLCKTNTQAKKKVAYQNFSNNIFNKGIYLRRRLGYLDPNIIHMYRYLPVEDKATIRILCYIVLIYICIFFAGISKGAIRDTVIVCFMVLLIIIIIEIVCKFFYFLFYKIRK